MNYQDMLEMIDQYQNNGGDMTDFRNHVNALASDGATPFLGLNQWKRSDKPVMEDFNEDNRIIDESIRGLQTNKANKSEVYTKVEANGHLSTKVSTDGSSVMSGSLQTSGVIIHHRSNESNPWAAVHFRADGKHATSLYSDKRGQAILRVCNPANESEYKELIVKWDGNMYWNGRKVLTE